jgi:hypothetical protein
MSNRAGGVKRKAKGKKKSVKAKVAAMDHSIDNIRKLLAAADARRASRPAKKKSAKGQKISAARKSSSYVRNLGKSFHGYTAKEKTVKGKKVPAHRVKGFLARFIQHFGRSHFEKLNPKDFRKPKGATTGFQVLKHLMVKIAKHLYRKGLGISAIRSRLVGNLIDSQLKKRVRSKSSKTGKKKAKKAKKTTAQKLAALEKKKAALLKKL